MDNGQILIGVIVGGALLAFAIYAIWRAMQPDAAGIEVRGTVVAPVVTSHEDAPAIRLSHVGGETVNPGEADIIATLRALQADSDDLAMLDAPDRNSSFLQAYAESAESYIVEFHDGATDRHFRAEPNPDLALTQSLFLTFNNREWEQLQRMVTWRDITTEI